ncbi:Uncharacterised protein [Halioglobus japonicus]|nr:Uncharacterised protein [Halioglobus japonicus]
MDRVALAWHIGICIIIGGVVAYFTPAKWIAASFWVSAALYINGSLAFYEDAIPGGFDNPNGTDTPGFAKGVGASKYAVSSLVVTIVLATNGFLAQRYL